MPQSRRDEVHALVRRELDAGRQAYVVYPLVEESAKVDVRAATEMADHLAARGVSRVPRRAAARPAAAGGEGARDAGVRGRRGAGPGRRPRSIEVGIDVPNATVMVVEHAERFGLAQLHQLRGRVGRGAHPSVCVLLYQEPLGDEGEARLQALAETTDGFVIAERDLELRGPGRRVRHPAVGHADAARLAIWCATGRSWSRRAGWPRPGARPRARAARWWRRPGGAGPAGSAWPRSDEAGCVGWRPGSGGAMRVIAGEYKGRRLAAPTWPGLRPTSDRLKETLFNILAPATRGGARAGRLCRARARWASRR